MSSLRSIVQARAAADGEKPKVTGPLNVEKILEAFADKNYYPNQEMLIDDEDRSFLQTGEGYSPFYWDRYGDSGGGCEWIVYESPDATRYLVTAEAIRTCGGSDNPCTMHAKAGSLEECMTFIYETGVHSDWHHFVANQLQELCSDSVDLTDPAILIRLALTDEERAELY